MKRPLSFIAISSMKFENARFFKIIHSETGLQTKLMIPRKFVRKYGNNLSSRISLKTPNGLVWQLNLERDEGEIWLQDGWPQFSRFYSIGFGYLLVFKYRGHCDFNVRIFNPSCMEVDYPSSVCVKLNIEESSQVNKRAIEIDHSTSSDLISPRKKRVKNLQDASQNGVCLMPRSNQEKTNLKDYASATEEANARALASAEAFKSENPFFILIVKPYILYGGGRRPYVPKTFKEAYENWKHNDQIILQVAGITSPVYCTLKLNGGMCRIGRGWVVFARDNSLNVGDVCVFELIIPSRKLFRVSIFRTTADEADKTGVLATSNAAIS